MRRQDTIDSAALQGLRDIGPGNLDGFRIKPFISR